MTSRFPAAEPLWRKALLVVGLGALLYFATVYLLDSVHIQAPASTPKTPKAPPTPKPELIQVDPVRTSKLHYLIPVTEAKPPLCAVVSTALLNRYSIPTLLGYKGEGEFDAHHAHIAKLRTIARYLHSSAGKNEDDLVIVVDGFDVLAEVPAEEMIQRYFHIMAEKDQEMADKYGMTVDDAHKHGLRQTLLWGTDKGCFPPIMDDPRCWLVPDSKLPRFKWGVKTANGELPYSESKFLNSGTVMGPLGDLRVFMDAVLKYIDDTWDEEFKYHDSDQYYIASMYARQEYYRNLETIGDAPDPGNRRLPREKKGKKDVTEFHLAVDYDTSFTQTQCQNEIFMHRLQYNNPDNTALMREDALGDGKNFHAFKIQMPSSLFLALTRLFEAIPANERPKATTAKQWVHSLKISTNVGTRKQYAFYHNTCSKKRFMYKFRASWYYDLLPTLLRSAVQANNDEQTITTHPIDGRMWVAAQKYPKNNKDEFGGVFTDNEAETYIPFQQLCDTTELFDIPEETLDF